MAQKRSKLAKKFGLRSLKGIKNPERNRMRADGTPAHMLDGCLAKDTPGDRKAFKAKRLGKLGAASEVTVVDPKSPEFAAIAARYK